MILRHSSGFRQRVFVVSLIQLASYSLIIQSQQSLAQQQGKAALCEWRYKHSLTSLQCYECVSKVKQRQDTVIVCHAATNVSLTVVMLPLACFRPFFSLWIVHNFLKLSVRFRQFIPSVDGCQHQVQPQSRTSKKNWRTLDFEHLILLSVFSNVISIVLPV